MRDALPYLPSAAGRIRLAAWWRRSPPWWWKPWLAPGFALGAWWHRPRPVKTRTRKDHHDT